MDISFSSEQTLQWAIAFAFIALPVITGFAFRSYIRPAVESWIEQMKAKVGVETWSQIEDMAWRIIKGVSETTGIDSKEDVINAATDLLMDVIEQLGAPITEEQVRTLLESYWNEMSKQAAREAVESWQLLNEVAKTGVLFAEQTIAEGDNNAKFAEAYKLSNNLVKKFGLQASKVQLTGLIESNLQRMKIENTGAIVGNLLESEA